MAARRAPGKDRASERIASLEAGEIRPSIVIPVGRVLVASQKVLPGSRMLALLKRARLISVTECGCRKRFGRCDAPVDVCIALNDMARQQTRAGSARRINITEAGRILDRTARAGLVHLALHVEGQEIDAICSCCSCCCHDLRAMIEYGHPGLVKRSDLVARRDEGACTLCGACVEGCHFGALSMAGGAISFSPERCFGCGICAAGCPSGAVRLVRRGAGHRKRRPGRRM